MVLVPFSTKLWLLIILPSLVITLFGVFAFRAVTPLAYRCRRCGGGFTRASHRGFPTRCALCRSTAWNER